MHFFCTFVRFLIKGVIYISSVILNDKLAILLNTIKTISNHMNIYLRPITESDGPSIVRWRNHPDVLSHCLDKTHITEESNREFYKKNVLTGKYKQFIVEYFDETTGV